MLEVQNLSEWLFEQDPESFSHFIVANDILASFYASVGRRFEALDVLQDNLSFIHNYFMQSADISAREPFITLAEHYLYNITIITEYYNNYSQQYLAQELLKSRIKEIHAAFIRNPYTELNDFCVVLSQAIQLFILIDCLTEAIEYLELCINQQQELFEENPTLHGMNFFNALIRLSNVYREKDDAERADATARRALYLAKEVAERDPDVWGNHFCDLVQEFTPLYIERGSYYKAIDLYETAALFLRAHFNQAPDKWWKIYSDILEELYDCYIALDLQIKAQQIQVTCNEIRITALKESALTLERSVIENPYIWIDDYISTLVQLSSAFEMSLQTVEAIHVLKKSIQTISENQAILFDWESQLITAFAHLKRIYRNEGRYSEEKLAMKEEQELLGKDFRP
jgi:tetratricopeptide (TPR) repeat protein